MKTLTLWKRLAGIGLIAIAIVTTGWGGEVDFTAQKNINLRGDLTIFGNTTQCLTSSTSSFVSTCDPNPGDHTSNDYFTKYVDIDDGTSLDSSSTGTFNSSGSTIALPTGSEVVWAGLYWQGFLHECKNGGTGEGSSSQCRFRFGTTYVNNNDVDPADVDADKVKLFMPNTGATGYTTVTSSQLNSLYSSTAEGTTYAAFAEITNLVNKTNPNGKYIVADVQSMEGKHGYGNFAAWAIVMIYKDPAGTMHNVVVYNGYKKIFQNSVDIPITGFVTPSTTPIASRLAVFAGEGEAKYRNDYIRVGNSNYVSNAANFAYNVFNSTVSGGTPDPVMTNYNGIDVDMFNTGSFMTPGQTSVNLRIGSTSDAIAGGSASASLSDAFYPSMIAFSTQIYAPELTITKTPSTTPGTSLSGGTQIDYTASFTNTGQEVAKDILIYDDLSQNMLQKTDGSATNPPVFLTNVIERDATKILRSIRLVKPDLTTSCPIGLSGIAGCTAYDANCSVAYTGDPATTATKVQCSVPTVAIGATYTMKFSLNLAANPDTSAQSVKIQNQMFASYKDNVTNSAMPDASSNVADAGDYLFVIPPVVAGQTPNPDQCGMFPSVLSADQDITSFGNATLICSITDPGTAGNDNNVINTTVINAGGTVPTLSGCTVNQPPPPVTLPTFMHTSVSATHNVSSDTTFSAAEIGNVNITGNNNTVTFTATATPYTDSSIKVMKIGSVNDNNRQGMTYIFNEGDYWIDSWFFDGNDANISINGTVRFFVANDFRIDSNAFTINVAPSSGKAYNFYLYGYRDILFLSNGFANSKIVGYLYAARDIVAEGNSNFQSFRGALRAGRDINLQQNQTFTYDMSGIHGIAADCIVPVYTQVGLFDAWDLTRSISDRKISTKISAKEFSLTLASLNALNTEVQLKPGGTKAYYRLYDFNTNAPKTEYALYDPSSNASVASSPFAVASANKNVKVQFKYCADYDGTYFILKSDSQCSGKPVCTQTNRVCYRETVSTDAFAIRPEGFLIGDVINPTLLRSGSAVPMTLRAHPFGSSGETLDYNQTSANLTISAVKRMKDGTVNPDLNGTASFPATFNLANGLSTGANMTFSDVGKITVDINDTEWASVDVNDTALVDRTIHGEGDYTYIPFQFAVSNVRIVDTNNTVFTYLSNDLNMSAKLDFNITAQNMQGQATRNFDSGANLYENPLSITPTIIDTVEGNAHTTPIANTLIGSFAAGVTQMRWDDANLTRQIRFNFTRPANPINPIEIVPSEVNLSVNSTYVDGTAVIVENNMTNQNGAVNGTAGNAVFLYGRADAPDYRFTTNSGCGRIYFEFYNTIANNAVVTGIFGGKMPPLSESPDRNWYQNTEHNTSLHGSITTATGTHITTNATGCMATTALGSEKRQFVYNAAATIGYPYRATVTLDASDWLDMQNNNFGVEYRQAGAWVGVESKTKTNTDENAELNTNRRITW